MSCFVEELETNYEQAVALQSLLVDEATGGNNSTADYEKLRAYLIKDSACFALLPVWLRASRDLSQFWSFIRYEFKTYRERSEFIRK